LVEQCGGDSERALATALAYISGHYSEALSQRSLLTGQERCITLEMKAASGKWPSASSTANMILRKYWPNQMVEQIRNMRTLKDGTGVVFDVYEDKCERFMDVFLHLKDSDSRVDFIVQKCSSLPDLFEEGGDEGYGSNWRGGSGNDGGFGGSSGGNNYRGGQDRNQSNGYGGGYSKGGYGRQSSDNQGFKGGRDWRTDGNQDNARTDWKGKDD
jgi:hypothetical protein